jgi:hypothetical protein
LEICFLAAAAPGGTGQGMSLVIAISGSEISTLCGQNIWLSCKCPQMKNLKIAENVISPL